MYIDLQKQPSNNNFNQSRYEGTISPPPISKYFSEIFSPSQIKLTKNNPNKDFKSVKRP